MNKGRYALVSLTMLCGFCPALTAQNIRGVVMDANGTPIPFVNVVELSAADSSFVGGTVSKDDGTFTLENVKSGDILRASLVGYETQCINYTGQTAITVKLLESTATLGEVVIKSHLPKTVCCTARG